MNTDPTYDRDKLYEEVAADPVREVAKRDDVSDVARRLFRIAPEDRPPSRRVLTAPKDGSGLLFHTTLAEKRCKIRSHDDHAGHGILLVTHTAFCAGHRRCCVR